MWWGYGREREEELFVYYEVRPKWRHKGSEEQCDVSILHCILRVCWCLDHAAAKGHVWVHCPAIAGVWVAVCVPCYNQKLCGHPWSRLLLRAILIPKGCADWSLPSVAIAWWYQ